MRSRLRRRVAALIRAVVACVALGVTAVEAQTVPGEPPALEEVEALVRQGRVEEARALLSRWWDEARAGAGRAELELAQWLRARLTVDPAQAMREYRRLVVEYPTGRFGAEALARLVMVAHALGEADAVQRYREMLTRDYPTSEARRRVDVWLAQMGPPGLEEVGGGAPPAEAAGGTSRSGTEGAGRAEAQPEEEAPTPAGAGAYAVQLGAFSSRERADALRVRAAEAGLEARVVRVRGSGLYHVRVGRFASSEEATAFFRQVRSLGFTAAVVRDADREEPPGR